MGWGDMEWVVGKSSRQSDCSSHVYYVLSTHSRAGHMTWQYCLCSAACYPSRSRVPLWSTGRQADRMARRPSPNVCELCPGEVVSIGQPNEDSVSVFCCQESLQLKLMKPCPDIIWKLPKLLPSTICVYNTICTLSHVLKPIDQINLILSMGAASTVQSIVGLALGDSSDSGWGPVVMDPLSANHFTIDHALHKPCRTACTGIAFKYFLPTRYKFLLWAPCILLHIH